MMCLVIKVKRFIKGFILVIIFVYLILFFSYQNGYYELLNKKKTELTEEMILKYEEDLKNGLDVTKEDYSIKDVDYSNTCTKASLKISMRIENIIDGGIKTIFKKINKMVNE